MTLNRLYIPLKILREDVIVDYRNKDVIFPNRPEGATQLGFKGVSVISNYLNAEGFLDTVDLAVFEPWALPFSGLSKGKLCEESHSSVIAKVSYVRKIGFNRVLVGFKFLNKFEVNLPMDDFGLEKLGEVECWGTGAKAQKVGWAVYTEFSGNSGDEILISEERHQCG